MKGNEIRERYLRFFEERGHLHLSSFPLIPKDDPSLLLIGAGMAPLKPFFTGKVEPPRHRVVTCQKCMRTGDLENVGRTARHHTFFEMLGNFSFGDYFKQDAIQWAWQFLTEELQLDPERLYVTVHPDDKEAYALWHETVGLPDERIYKLEDNFWEIGEGPCGPCSEIFYDQGESFGTGPENAMGSDGDRFLEIWNLVFTQYNRTKDGQYEPLAKKNIDTGAGLERLAAVLQKKRNNFETDLIFPIIERAAALAGTKYNASAATDVALKVIADHSRAVTALVGDGVLPSNEGRGYVLRRILRRAVRQGKLLGINQPFMAELVDLVIDLLGQGLPDLFEKRAYIKKIAASEEARFQKTLDQGSLLLQEKIDAAKEQQKTVLGGEDVFQLYDTYGFPWELTEEIAAEAGLTIDIDGFKTAMKTQRERARQARAKVSAKVVTPDTTRLAGAGKTADETATVSEILMLGRDGVEIEAASDGESVLIILATNPFHAEGGGQLGDIGELQSATGKVEITDTKKNPDGTIYLLGDVTEGTIERGAEVTLAVDTERRHDMARNHTATHLLQAALRHVLGDHVTQAGSVVMPERLRFDFTHPEPLSSDELRAVEAEVNERILAGIATEIRELPIEEAKELGAIALFGEKYGNIVRVVEVPEVSIELCGGSHVRNTGEIGSFRILSESGIGSGIRRIEAVTGHAAYRLAKQDMNDLAQAAELLKARPQELLEKLEKLLAEKKELAQELSSLHQAQAKDQVGDLVKNAVTQDGLRIAKGIVEVADVQELRALGDMLKGRDDIQALLLGARIGEKVNLVAMADATAVARGIHAGNAVKAAAKVAGGGGGGRPDMAQAGGKDPAKLGEAIEAGVAVMLQALA
ncbi:MAG: alanine--tRNA ligase [Negativicoccus succinicivorans]|uniref:alanine--tRNA ligase n=1 Tax=Negativicoccus succinicivorans TaxID=620903 RepID=UPI0026E9AC01|nr:alanine--tRNA ligase [Negativicoccus succinicivorans]MBS5887685.1 alanine--tRNA ligase [Negativicoccus succinicivorans]